MVEIALSGSNPPMCHGAGLKHAILGDLVMSMEIVNPKGDIVTISDRDELRVAAGSLGLLGPIVSLTLRLVKTTYAILSPKVLPAETGIPRPGSSDASAIDNFNSDAAKYYCEWFWFPGNAAKTLWINCWDDNGIKKNAKDYPSPIEAEFQGLGIYLTDKLREISNAKNFAEIFAAESMAFVPKNVNITTQVANALHFARGIQNIHVVNTEWHIGIPRKNGGNAPDLEFVRKIWWIIMDGISEQQKKK